jgi:hypothetical protein
MAKVWRNPELERRIQERLFVRISKAHETRIRRELVAQYRTAATAVEAGRKPPKLAGDRLTTAVASLMRDAYEQFGKRTATAIKDSQGRAGKRAVAMSPEFEAALGVYIRTYSARKVKDVDATTKARIARLIQIGIDEGLTNAEVAASIREAALIDSAYRSAVIARTESHAAAMAGSFESALETDVVIEKEWISAEDERTRDGVDSEFDHTSVDNVPMEQPFIVSGEELMFPGDPAGSPGNVINCRCVTGFVV